MPDPMVRKRYTNAPGPESLDLPNPPGRFRRALREHPKVTDWAIVVAFLLLTAIVVVVSCLVPIDGLPEDELRVQWEYPDYLRFPRVLLLILMVVVTAVALRLRRKCPLLSLSAALLMSMVIPEDILPSLALVLASALLLYTIPVYRSARAGWVGYLLANLATVPDSVISFQINSKNVFDDGGGIAAIITLALLMLVPVTLGINAGNRRRYTDAIIDRAHQLARERDQLARLAVVEERTRIAREMHDIIAHSVSVMVTLSEGAARAAEIQPAAAAEAMRQSAETGRSALTEMRRLIGALREPSEEEGRGFGDAGGVSEESGAELAPMPDLGDLPELIKGFRAAGLNVDFTLKGAAPGPDTRGEQGRDLAIYRTVQEALTNTLRHAGAGSTVRVIIAQGPEGTTISVVDDGGLPGNHPMTGLGSGHGLVGLRERLRVFGGRLEYGPMDGGWSVTAMLPVDEESSDVEAGGSVR